MWTRWVYISIHQVRTYFSTMTIHRINFIKYTVQLHRAWWLQKAQFIELPKYLSIRTIQKLVIVALCGDDGDGDGNGNSSNG